MIFNSELRAEGICIKASDNPSADENVISETRFSLFVSFSDRTEFESVGARLSAGGRVMMKHGDNFLMLMDKFGFSWMLSTGPDDH